jgi:hypothetical protein
VMRRRLVAEQAAPVEAIILDVPPVQILVQQRAQRFVD